MINQVRSLLADLAGQGCVLGAGEEFIPPEYTPLPLPQYLQDLRALLFGARPDRRARLFRLHQFMALLHATGLADVVTTGDPRVTYLPLDDSQIAFADTLTVLPLIADQELFFGGTPPGGTAEGQTEFSWIITVDVP